jgi:L-alanine-DL-glutamate epimerase-like enolase superfamily enzyme
MKITNVTARWLRCPIPAERQHVSDFGRQAGFDTTLVRVETDEGVTGYGEAKAAVGSSGACASIVACVERELAPALLGQDPRDITRLWEMMYCGPRGRLSLDRGRSMPALGRRGLTISAISGIDMALWDILGKALGVPVVRLLGGACRASMPAYASGGWADAEGIGAQLRSYVEAGFGAVKMRVGAMDGSIAASVARVRAARDGIGAGVELMCDAHGTMSPADAKRFCRGVEDCDLRWFEEPCTSDDHAGTAEVRRSTATPIALGESLFTRFEVREAIEARAADVIQPDAAIVGGVSECRRIAALCETHNLELAPHLWGSALSFMAGMHVAFASPAARVLEYSLGGNPMLHELATDAPRPEGGRFACPEAPGLGVTIDEDFAGRYAVGAG